VVESLSIPRQPAHFGKCSRHRTTLPQLILSEDFRFPASQPFVTPSGYCSARTIKSLPSCCELEYSNVSGRRYLPKHSHSPVKPFLSLPTPKNFLNRELSHCLTLLARLVARWGPPASSWSFLPICLSLFRNHKDPPSDQIVGYSADSKAGFALLQYKDRYVVAEPRLEFRPTHGDSVAKRISCRKNVLALFFLAKTRPKSLFFERAEY